MTEELIVFMNVIMVIFIGVVWLLTLSFWGL